MNHIAPFAAALCWILVAGIAAEASESLPEYLTGAVAEPDRPEGDRTRDVNRRPAEVLSFFGVQPGMTVVELMAGSGYYVEILSRAVGEDGKVIAHNNQYVLSRFAEGPLSARLEDSRLPNVERVTSEVDELPFEENSVDLLILNRFYHDLFWQKRPDGESPDRAKMNALVLRALKPGGVFGVVDHHAEPGSKGRDAQTLHRIDAELVKQEILAAGFVLDEESDLLKNSKDTRDWNIFSDNAVRRDKTDRFIYRFRKAKK